jgi:acetyl-CoA synthetase
MTTFQEARTFLLRHRSDYDAAVKGFRWPDPVPFNWALDWFDAELANDPASRDRPALWIVDGGSSRETKLSFAALSRRSNQAANFLRAQGVKRGDHLLLLLGNVVPLWETMLAAMKLGVVVIPATTLLTPDELQDRLDRGRAKVVVATQDQVAKFSNLRSEKLIRIVVDASPAQAGWLPYEDAVNFPETFTPDGPTGADEPMLLYFTSGTTAKPKLVRHSQRSYPVGGLSTMYWLGLQPGDVHLNISSPGWASTPGAASLRPGTPAPPCSWSISRASMPRRCSRPSAVAASPRCARRRRSGACSSRNASSISRCRCARSAARASRSIPR